MSVGSSLNEFVGEILMCVEPVGLTKTLVFNGTLRTERLELLERLLTRLLTDMLY